jgi:hypothetical protein
MLSFQTPVDAWVVVLTDPDAVSCCSGSSPQRSTSPIGPSGPVVCR